VSHSHPRLAHNEIVPQAGHLRSHYPRGGYPHYPRGLEPHNSI
jgi:hypothetical protein